MRATNRPHLFPSLLASLMQERGVSQVQLSGRSGIVVSRLNNYLHGKYRTITPTHLAAICAALGETPAETASVIQAYLFDLLPERARALIDIRIPGAKEPGKWAPPTKGLPAAFAEQFVELYRLCISRPMVRQRTAEWVQIMREVSR